MRRAVFLALLAAASARAARGDSSDAASGASRFALLHSPPTADTGLPTECAARPRANATLALVVPTYGDDLCVLRLLARGMARHAAPGLFVAIQLVWVSEAPMEAYAAERRAVEREFGDALAPLVRWVEHRRALPAPPGGGSSFSGWFEQQHAKLAAAAAVAADFCVVLDSKNAPIAPLGRADFLDGDGRALVHADFLLAARRNQSACADHCKYARWYAAAEAVLGTSVAAAHRVPKSITPTTLHVASVRALLASLDAREGGLSRALGPDGATEFTLYNAFVRGAGAVEPFECAHALSDVPTDEVAATVFTHSGLVSVDDRFAQMRGLAAAAPPPHARFFGLHRGFADQPEVRARRAELVELLRQLGRRRGLLRDDDDERLGRFCLPER